MITGFIINSLYVLLYNILSVFPTGTLPTEVSNAFGTIIGFVNDFSFLIAIDALLTVVGLVISFELAIVAVKVILWLVRTVRGSGGTSV